MTEQWVDEPDVLVWNGTVLRTAPEPEPGVRLEDGERAGEAGRGPRTSALRRPARRRGAAPSGAGAPGDPAGRQAPGAGSAPGR